MTKKNYNAPRTQRMDVEPQCMLREFEIVF